MKLVAINILGDTVKITGLPEDIGISAALDKISPYVERMMDAVAWSMTNMNKLYKLELQFTADKVQLVEILGEWEKRGKDGER